MEELIAKLKQEIIDTFNFEDMNPEDINQSEPLFGEGLGLDSIDALELIVLLEKNYGLKIDTAEQGKEIFYSIETLAKFIEENKK